MTQHDVASAGYAGGSLPMTLVKLIVVGDSFDVDGFLRATGLQPDLLWHKGDSRDSCADAVHSQFRNSGFLIRLGDQSAMTFREQRVAALRFLSSHKEALARLRDWPGVESASLQLSPEITIHSGCIAHGLFFPVPLVRLAGELGLDLGMNVRYKWQDDG